MERGVPYVYLYIIYCWVVGLNFIQTNIEILIISTKIEFQKHTQNINIIKPLQVNVSLDLIVFVLMTTV